jgi:hypothetical protein
VTQPPEQQAETERGNARYRRQRQDMAALWLLLTTRPAHLAGVL